MFDEGLTGWMNFLPPLFLENSWGFVWMSFKSCWASQKQRPILSFYISASRQNLFSQLEQVQTGSTEKEMNKKRNLTWCLIN